MFDENDHSFFESALFQSLGKSFEIKSSGNISGGCINNTHKIETNEGIFFIKWNDQEGEELFHKEELGLQLLSATKAIKIPTILGRGLIGNRHYLLLEYIKKGVLAPDFWGDFGSRLAALHKHKNEFYGLDHDNHIGRLSQKNSFKSNWIDFFIENRLEPQIALALSKNSIDLEFAAQFRKLYKILPNLIPFEPPSLLHGDLWSGNFMVNEEGYPCLFDPAVCYGHREMELAFTHLFGGFNPPFYETYKEAYPLEMGFEDRIDIYNMYPLLVHVNLFGRSYLSGIQQTMKRHL